MGVHMNVLKNDGLSSKNNSQKAKISEEEKKRRKEATDYARASIGLEGFKPSAYAEALMERLNKGEIDGDGYTALILDHYKKESSILDHTPQERHNLESDLTWRRIRELGLNPIKGDFDAAHLKSIHRYIFQDLAKAGLNHIPPGSFREESSTGKWLKNRQLTTKPIIYQVAYSAMDKASVMALDSVLKGARPEDFSGLDLKTFNQKMGKLYADLDFIHPFVEGNSRTLREFSRQLAKESGFDVNWDKFYKNDAGRDILYIARDLSVIERALNLVKDEDLLHCINVSQFRIKDNRKLPDLIKDVVRPS
jgi:cell filamentation protein